MTDETAAIERDLAATRARMDSRLDELQDKMSPSQLANDALAYFGGGDGADFTANLVARARANPWPLALVGVGLVWLMASSHARSPLPPEHRDDDLHARLSHAESSVVRLADEDDESYGSRLDDARGKVLDLARNASDTAASYAERVKDAVAAATQGVRRGVHDVSDQAQRGVSGIRARAAGGTTTMQGGTAKMTSSVRHTLSGVTANPLALGAIAAVVGLVAGALLPTRDEEQAALGPLAGRLRSAGSGLAQDVVDRGGRLANDTLAAVKDSAGAHGLTSDKSVGDVVQGLMSGDLVADVKQVAGETLQAGRDSAQTQFARSDREDAAPDA